MSESNLYHASRQWAERPDDERFWTLAEMHAATQSYRDSARTAVVPIQSLRAEHSGRELTIRGNAGTPARLTHWSMGQLARTVGAPADYLRSLPAPLAAENLNHGLAQQEGQGNLLIHSNGSLVLRSLTSDSYSRIWDCEVIARLMDLERFGWRVPPARPCREGQAGARPATQADVLARDSNGGGLSVRVGDSIAPAGLYASDHDMFAFLVNEQRVNDGSPSGLARGFFISNSEVGAAALKVTAFLYRHVCGNHIVWGAEKVSELRIVHRGNADTRFHSQLVAELRTYANRSAAEDEQRIADARRFVLGDDKEAVLESLFSKLRGDLSRKLIDAAYDRAAADSDSDRTIDPRTAWGMAQGLTAYSQETLHTDERVKIDRAAGKVLAMAF